MDTATVKQIRDAWGGSKDWMKYLSLTVPCKHQTNAREYYDFSLPESSEMYGISKPFYMG